MSTKGINNTLFEVPYKDPIADGNGLVSYTWQKFLRLLKDTVDQFGSEKSFDLANNQTPAADIVGLAVNSERCAYSVVEYLIQRVTTGAGAVELIQAGIFILVYLPTSKTWSLINIGSSGPSASGIFFSINSSGQVKYTSTNITGTHQISKIYFRIRSLKALNSLYSVV